jgi:hypothetical protein
MNPPRVPRLWFNMRGGGGGGPPIGPRRRPRSHALSDTFRGISDLTRVGLIACGLIGAVAVGALTLPALHPPTSPQPAAGGSLGNSTPPVNGTNQSGSSGLTYYCSIVGANLSCSDSNSDGRTVCWGPWPWSSNFTEFPNECPPPSGTPPPATSASSSTPVGARVISSLRTPCMRVTQLTVAPPPAV